MDITANLIQQSFEVMSLESRFHSEEWFQFTMVALGTYAPMKFFYLPASSSGRYHQGYELGVGGLVRHTVAAMEVARTLFTIYDFSEEEQDRVVSALALHDICKPSKTHPIEVGLVLEPLRDQYHDKVEEVVSLIRTHHGQWDHYGKMPRPKTELQKFVHLCDYLASRKNIAVDINYKEEET